MIISIYFATYIIEFGNRVYLYTHVHVKAHMHICMCLWELEVKCLCMCMRKPEENVGYTCFTIIPWDSISHWNWAPFCLHSWVCWGNRHASLLRGCGDPNSGPHVSLASTLLSHSPSPVTSLVLWFLFVCFCLVLCFKDRFSHCSPGWLV